ncbi:MAG: hypothetical protein H0U73_11090 [Tatlockia sp.]|nr:hypothetical protein [Tatlockia sp.]
MTKKNLKEVICDTFFGATGAALSQHEFEHTIIQRDLRIHNYKIGSGGKKLVKPAFFMPYESGLDIVTKLASIPLAPGAFLVESSANVLASMSYGLVALLRLCIFDFHGAKKDSLIAGTFLLSSLQQLSAAILSPLLNLVDLLVSGINTLAKGFSEDDDFGTLTRVSSIGL